MKTEIPMAFEALANASARQRTITEYMWNCLLADLRQTILHHSRSGEIQCLVKIPMIFDILVERHLKRLGYKVTLGELPSSPEYERGLKIEWGGYV